MSAEVLREAARLMRGKAEAATPGPWSRTDDHQYQVGYGRGNGVFDETPMAKVLPGYGGVIWPWDAAHIASWHPTVALAVADWLDTTADDMAENTMLDRPESGDYEPAYPEALWCEYCGGAIESTDYASDDQRCRCARWTSALAVARAYLGADR